MVELLFFVVDYLHDQLIDRNQNLFKNQVNLLFYIFIIVMPLNDIVKNLHEVDKFLEIKCLSVISFNDFHHFFEHIIELFGDLLEFVKIKEVTVFVGLEFGALNHLNQKLHQLMI